MPLNTVLLVTNWNKFTPIKMVFRSWWVNRGQQFWGHLCLVEVILLNWVEFFKILIHWSIKESKHTTCMDPHDFVPTESVWIIFQFFHQSKNRFTSVDTIKNNTRIIQCLNTELTKIDWRFTVAFTDMTIWDIPVNLRWIWGWWIEIGVILGFS